MKIEDYENEPKNSRIIRNNVKSIYEKYKNKLGKEIVNIKISSNNRISKYFELLNTAIILNEFLNNKDIYVVCSIYGNIFKKERELIIRPKITKNWN